ncbi:MAG: PAS domain S-box protein, partial [Deltaproteobacteria bacterium]|nr:PAS domain S-box protein [Deltaproteobacteria bacterium]
MIGGDPKNLKPYSLRGSLLGLAAGLGIGFWLLESVVDCYLFRVDGLGPCLAGFSGYGIWMRLLVVALLVGWVIYAGFTAAAQKRVEAGHQARLVELQARQRFVEDYAGFGLAIVEDDRIIEVNETVAAMFGYDRPDELTGKSVNVTVHPDDQERVRKWMVAGQMGESPSTRDEFQGIRKDGTPIYLEASAHKALYQGKPVCFTFLRDVSREKRAEQATRECEERYRTTFHETPDVFCIIRISDGRYMEVNDSYCTITGHSREEIIGRTFFDTESFIVPDEVKRFIKIYEEKQKIDDFEFRFRIKDGTALYMLASARPIMFSQEKCLAVVAKDVSSLKEIEEALKNAQERYQVLVEENFDGIFVHQNFKIIFANRRLYQMLNYKKDGLIGLEHWRIYHPDFQTLTAARARIRLNGGTVISPFQVKMLRNDGSSFDAEIHAWVISLKGEPAVQVCVRDITERKQAETALRESEKRYR